MWGRTNRTDSAKKMYVDPVIALQYIKLPAMIYSELSSDTMRTEREVK